ncbi:MAG TPA: SAM-dependent chlorinase/fluorinase, partial [bacterium]
LGILPEVPIVDISHNIEPQNIDSAAFVVGTTYKFFPVGTIHVVVVDPGVGSQRRVMAVSAFGQVFLAPDNGTLGYVLSDCPSAKVYHVSNTNYFLRTVSQTFHGRDIFAPVAAHLAKGLGIEELGAPIYDYKIGRIPKLLERDNEIGGEIIYVDRFGNLVSNVPLNQLRRFDESTLKITIGQLTIDGLVESYFAGKPREPLALIGSAGYLEIAINSGNAQKELNCEVGEPVKVYGS